MKQIIVVRKDLKMPSGKTAAQCAHASVECVLKLISKGKKELVNEWRSEGMMKVVVKVDSLKELLKVKEHAEDNGLMTALITDAGHTVVEPGTVTCLGIGPDEDEKIDVVTKNLKLV